jgi:hypothetical protein
MGLHTSAPEVARPHIPPPDSKGRSERGSGISASRRQARGRAGAAVSPRPRSVWRNEPISSTRRVTYNRSTSVTSRGGTWPGLGPIHQLPHAPVHVRWALSMGSGSRSRVEASERGSQRPWLGQFGHKVEVQTGVGCTRPVCPHRCQGSGDPRGPTKTPEDGRTEGAPWRTAAVYIVNQPVGLRRVASRVTLLRHGVTVGLSTSRCLESASRSIIPTRPSSPVA